MSLELETTWVRDLYRALDRARTHADAPEPGAGREWNTVYRCLRPLHHGHRNGGDDGLQDLMVALVVSIGAMEATTPTRAAAWVKTVRVHLAVDRARKAERSVSLVDTVPPHHPSDEPEVPRVAVESVLVAFERHVASFVATLPIDEPSRVRRVLQARAALRRLVLDERIGDIARSLGDDMSPNQVSKWIERGRDVIIATVDWMRETAPELADVYEILAEFAADRRADAGLPRPARRRASRCAN